VRVTVVDEVTKPLIGRPGWAVIGSKNCLRLPDRIDAQLARSSHTSSMSFRLDPARKGVERPP